MNLLNLLKLEIEEKGILNDKFAIARYIYIRTGELFDYQPLYGIFPTKIQEDFNYERKDITDIRDWWIICYSWSRLYVDLLTAFNINAKVIEKGGHAKALVMIDGYDIVADLTTNFTDFYFVKFGFPTKNYTCEKEGFEEKVGNVDKKIGYSLDMPTDEVLKMFKKEITNDSFSLDEMVENAFLACKYYLDFHQIASISARRFILYFVNYVTDNIFKEQFLNTFVFDFSSNTRIDIFSINDCCYIYGMSDGVYKFRKASLDEIKELDQEYESCNSNEMNLILKK